MIDVSFAKVMAAVAGDFEVPKTEFTDASVATILQIVFGIAGGVAIIIMLLASLKYVISRGEPGEVAKAKNAIIYAAIGLVVIATAFAIVGFVAGRV